MDNNSSSDSNISVGTLQDGPPRRLNIYGSLVSVYIRAISIYLTILRVLVACIISLCLIYRCCFQVAESEAAPPNEDEPMHEEPTRTFCSCKSACKTKQKNGVGRGCPCRTANLPCEPNRCKCGTARKPCANRVSFFFFTLYRDRVRFWCMSVNNEVFLWPTRAEQKFLGIYRSFVLE